MLKIGDFSRLSMVSIRMLRYYDEHGILSPAYIDKFTGYRYYETKQLSEISNVKLLRDMGISISEIKILKHLNYSPEAMLTVIKECRIKMQAEYSDVEKRLLTLDKTIKKLERNETMPKYNVELKTVPKRSVAALRETIPEYKDEGELWKKIYSLAAKNDICLSNDCPPVAVYMDNDHKDESPDIEVQIGVNGKFDDTEILKFKEVPETLTACVTFTGWYDQICDIYKSIAERMEINGYDFNGHLFLEYITSPSEINDKDGLISNLCIPVKKI